MFHASRRQHVTAVLSSIALLTLLAAPVTSAGDAGLHAIPASGPAPHPARHLAPLPERSASPAFLRGGLGRLASESASGTLANERFDGYVTAGSGRTSVGAARLAQSASATQVAVSMQVTPGAADAVAAALRQIGGRVVNRAGNALDAYVPAAGIPAFGRIAGILDARPVLKPVVSSSVSPAVALQGAAAWQTAGHTGQGIKVGIIDGGFEGFASRLGTELPAAGNVQAWCYTGVGTFTTTLSDCANGETHGTAVSETVFDMAPGVSLYIADPLSQLDFQQTVSWMTSNGVKIINASLGFEFEGPGDGTDPTGHSMYTVVNQAVSAGAMWVNSSGNAGTDGWIGPWVDTDTNQFLEFSGTDEGNTLPLHSGDDILVILRWNDAWGTAADDYDLYVYGPTGTSPVASSTDTQNGHGLPAESVAYTATSTGDYFIAIKKHSGSAVTRLQLLVLTSADADLQYQTPTDTLPTPADSANPGMLTVGAVSLNSPTTIEPYSSRGPTVDNRVKPDLVAVDCADTTIDAPFCGTSEASPFVAGAAALALEANPGMTPAQLAAFLKSRATALGSPVPNSVFGVGRLSMGPIPGGTAPAGLAFVTQPVGAAAGSPLSSQPAVKVVDSLGATVTSGPGATLAVTLALGVNPSAATLSCTGGLTKAAVAGVATFSGCFVSAAGPGDTLVASGSGVPDVSSNPFDVTAAGPPPPIGLAFATQPGHGAAGGSLSPQPVIQVTDTGGQPITSGPSATTPVTLALVLGANPAGPVLTCTGGLTTAAVAGKAAFSGCSVSAIGSGFTLQASAAGAANPAVSLPFDIVAGPPNGTPPISLTKDATAILWGTGVTFHVHLGATPGGPGASGRLVHLQSSSNRTTWTTVGGGDLTLDGAGNATKIYRPVTNLYYRASFDGDADYGAAATAGSDRVTVRQLIVVSPANGTHAKIVRKGSTSVVTFTVRPARVDVPPGSVTVQLYTVVGGHAIVTQSITVTPSSDGKAVIQITWGNVAGRKYVRGMANPTGVNANSFWTANQYYTVQ